MTLEEMIARQAAIVARMEEIDAEHTGDGGEVRAIEDTTVQAEWDQLEAEEAELRANVERVERRQATLSRMAQGKDTDVDGKPISGGVERGSGPNFIKKTDKVDLFDFDRARMNSGGEIERFKNICLDNARHIVEDMPMRGVDRKNRQEARDQVVDLIESYDTKDGVLAQRIMRTGSDDYARAFGKMLVSLSTHTLTNDEQRALAIGADATGGYLVPPELDPTIVLTDTIPITPIRALSRVEKIAGTKWQGITSAGVTVSRDAEAEEVSDDSPTLARTEVGISRVAGFVPFSFEADMDWPGLQREMRRMLDRAKVKEEGTAFLTGSGVGLNPQGLLTGATTTILTAGAFTSQHIYDMENALADEFLENAVWLGNKAVYNKVRQFATTDGHSLWERIGAGQPQQLLGYNTYTASGMTSDVATATGKLLLLGDLQEAFIIIDRIGMSVDLIPHLFGVNGRPTGQRGIYAIWRNGSKVLRPEAVRVLVKS